MKYFFISTICLISTFAHAQSISDKKLKSLDKEIESIMKLWDIPGVSVGVVKDGKTIYSKGIGYRDKDKELTADENTLFAIGSCTKAFTASMLGKLADERKLDFKDKVTKHLPAFSFYSEEMNKQISIKDLMTHQTGVPRYDLSWFYFPTQDLDSMMNRIQYLEPVAEVREKTIYNNFMFGLQGKIVEKLTDHSWKQNLDSMLLKPLQMTRTTANFESFVQEKNKSIGYESYYDSPEKTFAIPYRNIEGINPAGGIFSSAKDMNNWMKMWLNEGKFNDKSILPSNYVKEASSSQVVFASGYPEKYAPHNFIYNYGYAWLFSSWNNYYMVSHNGAIDGFNASVSLIPTEGLGVVVLANRQTGGTNAISRVILQTLLDVKKDFTPGQEKNETDKWMKNASEGKDVITQPILPSRPLQEFVGRFEHKGFGKLNVILKNDSLFAYTANQGFYLKPYRYNVLEAIPIFFGKISPSLFGEDLKMNFQTDFEGDIAVIDILMDENHIQFERIADKLSLTKEDLLHYQGDYDFGGDVAKVYIDK